LASCSWTQNQFHNFINILTEMSIIFLMMYFQHHILERGKLICGRENAILFGPSLYSLTKGLKTYGVMITINSSTIYM
jgi:hypothetical protein